MLGQEKISCGATRLDESFLSSTLRIPSYAGFGNGAPSPSRLLGTFAYKLRRGSRCPQESIRLRLAVRASTVRGSLSGSIKAYYSPSKVYYEIMVSLTPKSRSVNMYFIQIYEEKCRSAKG